MVRVAMRDGTKLLDSVGAGLITPVACRGCD